MGKQKTGKSIQGPGFAAGVQPAVGQLGEFFNAVGTQPSPFYSDLQRMYSQTLGTNSFQLPDYLTKTLESAATTGMPSLTPLEQTEFYKAIAPTLPGMIERVKGATKENFGAQGALRSSAYSEAAGKGITKGLSDQLMQVAQQAYALEKAAKDRQMQAIPQALQASLAPYIAAQVAGKGAQAISGAEYPFLNAMLQFAQSGAGQYGKSSRYITGMQQAAGLMTGIGNLLGGVTGGKGCCWTFIQGEGEITECVRKYRDEHFGKWSDVGIGYRWLSFKLVPLMKRFKIIQLLVKTILTSPLSTYAEFHYHKNSYGFLFKPLASFWIGVWRGIGKLITYRDTKVIAI